MSSSTVRRCAVVVSTAAVALAALAGCAAPGTTTVLTVAAPAAASPGPATKTVPTVAKPTSAAPALKNTGAAWPSVITSMLTYGQWLLANPNPTLANTITEPGCASANHLIAQLQSLVEQNAYVQPSAPVLTSIMGPHPKASTPAAAANFVASLGSRATVDVRAVRAAEPISERTSTATRTTNNSKVTSTTRILHDKAQLPPTDLRITLVLGGDNHWRFCGITDLTDGPDAEAISTLL